MVAILETFRPRPTHNSLDAERAHRKRCLAVTFRLFARAGFDLGVAGHISARDPEWLDQFWVNPLGMHFGQIRACDLVLVNSDGIVVSGNRPINRAAFAIHSAIHAARPDVVAAAHAHTPHGRAWSTFGRLLEPLTQDACAFFEDHSIFDDYTGVVLDVSEGARIAEALGKNKAILLRNHGLLTVGRSVEETAWWFLSMEDVCRVQLLAGAAGKPLPIPDEAARHTARQVGSEELAWMSFQPLWDVVTSEHPEVLN